MFTVRGPSRRISRKTAALATASTFALSFAAAHAQTPAPAQTAQPTEVEEIVVTGSRVVRDGYQAPTPVSVLGVEQLQQSGVPQLADFVNELPSVAGSTSRNDVTVSSGLQGLALLNLRALGTTRTLVLLDGQRSVPSAVTGEVDVNNMPAELVSRVDVVTGGASAAYGSDALSGVVNFVLDKTYTGLKGEVSGGVTTYGDNRSYRISITGGTGFASDRGHFLFSAQTDYTDAVLDNRRAWNLQGYKIMLNPAYVVTNGVGNGQPDYLVVDHAGISTGSPGGIITNTALRGIEFGPGGVPRQFNYGSLTKDPYTVGGDWAETTEDMYQSLDTLLSRQSAFTRASYDLTDNINAFVQLSWNRTYAFHYDAQQYQVAALTVKADNAFIPPQVAAQMTALKITQFTLGTFSQDLGPFATKNDRYTNRYVVGANGKFDAMDTGWKWDTYYQKGVTRASENIFNTTIRSAFSLAIDAVHAPNGVIVCRSTLTNPTNGCVPWNVMGLGVNSQAAKNYITGEQPHRNERFTEDAMAFNVNGEPVQGWAGPISLAVGIEHRREAVSGASSARDQAGDFFVGNFRPNFGHYDVTEGYVETVIPLAKETAWAKSLDLNAAVRATGYSVSGYVTTWKVGLTYNPIDDIRLRATRSRDIRAPNLNELFATGTSNTNSVTDPFSNNATVIYTGLAVGNLNLTPEVADTTGLGVVLQPSFFPGFNTSLDYYNIEIANAIGSVGAQDIVNFCFQGQQQYCSALTSAIVNGVKQYTRVLISPFNLISRTARGMDIEASYTTPLSAINSDWDGKVTARFLATHFLKNYSQSGIAGTLPTDSVGENSGSGPPNWRYLFNINYTNDPISFTLTGRGVSAGVYSNSYIECTSGCPTANVNHETINNNQMAGALYWDTTINYKFSVGEATNMEAYLNIKNLMNTDPVPFHQGPLSNAYKASDANPALYDLLGRVFRAGIRFKM